MTLKDKLRRAEFVRLLVADPDLTTTEAYKRAGYLAKGHAAESAASRLWNRVEIQQAITQSYADKAVRLEITRERWLREVWRLGSADPAEAYDTSGDLLAVRDMPEDIRRAVAFIQSFEEFEGRGEKRTKTGDTRLIRFWDKNTALTTIGKSLGFVVEKVEHTGADGGPIPLVVVRPMIALPDIPQREIDATPVAALTDGGGADVPPDG